MSTKIISVCNQKGGVMKTTLVVSLAMALSLQHKKVLVIDFDPQGNCSLAFGIIARDGEPTTKGWLLKQISFKEAVRKDVRKGIDLLPSNIELDEVTAHLQQKTINPAETLLKVLAKTEETSNYDYIIIDSNPHLDLLTQNVLCASDEVIIPMQPEAFSFQGMRTLLDTVEAIQEDVNPDLVVNGIVFTKVDSRRGSVETQRKYVNDKIISRYKVYFYKNMLNQLTDYAESPNFAQTIYEYKPNGNAVKNFNEFVKEFIKREKQIDKEREDK